MRCLNGQMLIQVPQPLRAKLDALRSQGYIRSLLEREIKEAAGVN
jgi:hypothetical protein